MKRVTVRASREYEVRIGRGILKDAGEQIREITGPAAAMIVTDDIVGELYGRELEENLTAAGFSVCSFRFPHGEAQKNLQTYGDLMETLCERRLTRKDIIVALGGGVTGDLAGFAAATYQRGIRFVQIPTTLLACVDSSVGGKTAVDLRGGKNQAGCFYQPSLVLCDPDTLRTLPDEQYRCGLAEVIKYALIGSPELYRDLMEKDIRDTEEEVITSCVAMKRDIVERDEFDTGERMLLNFGHTFGHAAESCSDFSILHGQAVAMGMAVMTRSACAKGYCDSGTVSAVEQILHKYRLPDTIPYSSDALEQMIRSDKKMSGQMIRIVVPREVGNCSVITIPADELTDWMREGGIHCG